MSSAIQKNRLQRFVILLLIFLFTIGVVKDYTHSDATIFLSAVVKDFGWKNVDVVSFGLQFIGIDQLPLR